MKGKVVKLLKQSIDYQTKKLEIPNGAHLFDIALCRCFPFGTSKTTFVTSECKCGAEMTKESQQFYMDQRFERKYECEFQTRATERTYTEEENIRDEQQAQDEDAVMD